MSLLHHHCHCMWTVCHFTGLILETSYFVCTCTFGPGMYMHIKYLVIVTYIFYSDSHFAFFLYLSLLPIWFNLELSYLAQICICSWVTHAEGILYLLSIFLKLHFFLKKCNIHWVFEDYNELFLLVTITYIL